MDGSTEPVLAVIGYPIAGNPAQFAIERGLASLDLDWRVLSFEVPPRRLGAALDGIEVLGFHGLMVDRAAAGLTGKWFAQHSGDLSPAPPPVDCLVRSPGGPARFSGIDAEAEWLSGLIRRHFEIRGRAQPRLLFVGGGEATPPADRLLGGSNPRNADRAERGVAELGSVEPGPPEPLRCDAAPQAEQIEQAELIVLAEGAATLQLRPGRWSRNDASKLVVDLTAAGHPQLTALAERGYSVVSPDQRRLGTLLTCLRHWTGLEPDREIVQDAIDEYLAV